NIFPGTTIDKYWSDAVTLINTQLPAVVATSAPFDFAFLTNGLVMRFNKPTDSITPPKANAQRISQIVFSLPAIPRELSKLVAISLSVVTDTDPPIAFMIAI